MMAFFIGIFTDTPYMYRAGLPDMMINALVISGLDPGAVPGDSTINTHSRECF